MLLCLGAGAWMSACERVREAQPSSGGTFKLGVVLPLTGATAWGGRPAKVAAELAAADINADHLAGPVHN